MLRYAQQDGQDDDHWGECLNVGTCVEYFEQNATLQVKMSFSPFAFMQ